MLRLPAFVSPRLRLMRLLFAGIVGSTAVVARFWLCSPANEKKKNISDTTIVTLWHYQKLSVNISVIIIFIIVTIEN